MAAAAFQPPVLEQERLRRSAAREAAARAAQRRAEAVEAASQPQPAAASPPPGASPPPPPQQPQPQPLPPPPQAEAAPFCRICHCGPESGRLISPCFCSGSLASVHGPCLNAWRAMSAGTGAMDACAICGCVYNVRRATWAAWATDERVVAATAASLLAAAVLIASLLHWALGLRLERRLFRLLRWAPPWHPPPLAWLIDAPGGGEGLSARFAALPAPSAWV